MSGKAVITGITGQDGSYLAELLLAEGYEVVGLMRRCSTPNLWRLQACLPSPRFRLVIGDATDPFCVARLLSEEKPSEVYNLAAQSHVGVSFMEPSHTTGATYLSCLNCLEAIRAMPEDVRPKFYQASSSEMFGSSFQWRGEPGMFEQVHPDRWYDHHWPYQDEGTPMLPNSPYAIAKLAAHHACRVYRSSYGVFASCGILFNHESPRRGPDFVTRKVCSYVHRLNRRLEKEKLKLGNVEAQRDWGHARDYMRAAWLMLQRDHSDDFVVATGESHSVRMLCDVAFSSIGLDWQDHVEFDRAELRPCEVPYLRGDASKARKALGWSPSVSFRSLVQEMVDAG